MYTFHLELRYISHMIVSSCYLPYIATCYMPDVRSGNMVTSFILLTHQLPIHFLSNLFYVILSQCQSECTFYGGGKIALIIMIGSIYFATETGIRQYLLTFLSNACTAKGSMPQVRGLFTS